MSFKVNWMKELDSEVAGISKDTQQIQPKPKTQLSRTVRPVGGSESTKRCVLTPNHGEEDQTGTERPVLVDQEEEHEIDFRVPGLSHALVKEAEHLRVQELVKRSTIILIEKHFMPTCSKITSSTHSARIRRRWSANWVMWIYSRCSKLNQKYNVLSHCLLYWNQGIVYCTCGHCLIDSESRRKFNKLRLDALSIPNYVIKKGPTHGARHGKTEEQAECPYGLECVEEMLQESRLSRCTFYRFSRSISQRSSLSWITTRNRMDRTKVRRDARTCQRRPFVPSLYKGIQMTPRTMVSHLE